jgi:hypothetical protein
LYAIPCEDEYYEQEKPLRDERHDGEGSNADDTENKLMPKYSSFFVFSQTNRWVSSTWL